MRKVVINETVELSTAGIGKFWLGTVDGLATPAYRTSSIDYAGTHGGEDPLQLYGRRIVSLPGGIDGDNCDDHFAARQELLAAMPLNQLVPVDFHMTDGRVLRMYAKFEQPNLPIGARDYTNFQLVARANSYVLLDVTSGSANSITVSKRVTGGLRWFTGSGGAGLRWYSGSGLRWFQGAGAENAVNTGSTIAYPIITITGANQNPIVRNITTGKEIKINVTTSASDVIVINTDPTMWSVKLNDGNINGLVEGSVVDFGLEIGDNLIEFYNDNASGGSAELEWYNAIIGV